MQEVQHGPAQLPVSNKDRRRPGHFVVPLDNLRVIKVGPGGVKVVVGNLQLLFGLLGVHADQKTIIKLAE